MTSDERQHAAPSAVAPDGGTSPAAAAPEADGLELDERQVEEMRGIFAASLPQYLDPLEELCRELLGGGGAEVAAAFRATAAGLREAADKMGFGSVSETLRRLEDAVAPLGGAAGAPVGVDERELVLGLVLDLRQIADELGAARDTVRGRPLLERLAGMPGAADVAARLARAGLVIDAQLDGASPDEIAAVSGLDRGQVARALAWLAGRGAAEAVAPEPPPAPAARPPDPRPARADGDDEAERLAGEVAALVAATERLGARLEEARVDTARSRGRMAALRDERAALAGEIAAMQAAVTDVERWLARAAGLRAQLLAQRDLYLTARREAEHLLRRRRGQLDELARTIGEQQGELGASRVALEELDTMVRGLRARFARARALK